jgi:hypothetical protein
MSTRMLVGMNQLPKMPELPELPELPQLNFGNL